MGFPKVFLLGPLLLFVFVNGLPVVVNFGNPLLFADDFKLLIHGNLESEIQSDLEQVARWVKENRNELNPNKCSQLVRIGRILSFWPAVGPLESTDVVLDLGVVVNILLAWSMCLENQLNKSNKVVFCLRRNQWSKVNDKVNICLYKMLLLPISDYGVQFNHLIRLDLHELDLQKRVL